MCGLQNLTPVPEKGTKYQILPGKYFLRPKKSCQIWKKKVFEYYKYENDLRRSYTYFEIWLWFMKTCEILKFSLKNILEIIKSGKKVTECYKYEELLRKT